MNDVLGHGVDGFIYKILVIAATSTITTIVMSVVTVISKL